MLVFSRLKAAVILGTCLVGFLIAALTLMPSQRLPAWGPHPQINLGLDLQGGSYLLLEVDMNAVIQERLEAGRAQAIQVLRSASIRHSGLFVGNHTLTIQFQTDADRAGAEKELADLLGTKGGGPSTAPIYATQADGPRLTLTRTEPGLADLTSNAVQQSTGLCGGESTKPASTSPWSPAKVRTGWSSRCPACPIPGASSASSARPPK
jgi:SecD/SecF fusion protein